MIAAVVVAACTAAACSPIPSTLPAAPPTPPPAASAAEGPTAATELPATTMPTAETTAPGFAPAGLVLAGDELVTLSDGAAVRASWTGGDVLLTAARPAVAVDVGAGAELRFTYVSSTGEDTDITWLQAVAPGSMHEVRQPWRGSRSSPPSGVALVWQALGDRRSYREQLDRAPGITVTSPVWWFIRADGTLGDASDAGFVADAHDRGLAVWPAVAGLDADANHRAFGDPGRRSDLARTLAERALAIGADGVNVDIEGYREADAAGVTAFVVDLATRVRGWGGVVSYDVIPITDTWTVTPPELSFWSTAPQRRELAEAVDYMILMAYDQFNRYRPAGPVAAPAWVEEALRHLLRYADADRVVLGIPFYARIWDPERPERPRAVGVGSLTDRAAGGIVTPDPAFGLNRVDLADGRFFWFEDEVTVAQRLDLVDEYGLAGWAAWRLGFDSPRLWDALAGSAAP